VTELRGNSASKGKSVGRVKIINNSLDFSKINDGDILVSSVTTPEMVPIMKKSSAFITDEGGITCHAAIVARELKKPCIIGTKIATKVLKDGDMVEVDADKGIVNIIK
jgi:pyruvate,water dikinase